jgi:signal transduction histidine kinase
LKEKLNNTIAGIKQFLRRTSLVLLAIMAFASVTIVVVNYYSIRLLSGARAYNNGESEYSKAQKDAAARLADYIYMGNEADYNEFLKDIKVNQGDRDGRIALSADPPDYETARRGFLQGRNHSDDVGVMIWVFVNFKDLPMFKKAIGIWHDGDAMVDEMYRLGLQAHQKMQAGQLKDGEKRSMILAVNNLSARLTVLEEQFSEILGKIGRAVALYVFVADVVIMLVIVFSSMLSAAIMIRNLANSKKKIIEQNDSLQQINAELDKFVYNVTHDLRSPVASLVGLVDLIREEKDPEMVKSYFDLMKDSLEKQDKFISEMLTFVKSKHSGVNKQECNLENIVDNVITLNSYASSHNGKHVKIHKEVELNAIRSDPLKLQVILNNLVSNSIKYSDPKKPEQWVKVRTCRLNGSAVIEVQDNGVGIRQKDQERIFDKFYLAGENKNSSGLGLYLVKDAVTQLEGKIEVRSEPGVSSTFIISLPN